ncbi:MAG: hypothetical protein KJ915_13260 [Candidatus Omnitrophica bacterium]|nr:hypothetical protein [Candidatus Omnitrophota bacterium]
MIIKNTIRTLVLCLAVIIFSSGYMVYAQEPTEQIKLGLTNISAREFNPKKDKEIVFSGEMAYLTRSGVFDAPEVKAQISELGIDLAVELTIQPTDSMLPEEYRHLFKHWEFRVSWDGIGKDTLPADFGRYQCIISAKILKKDTITETGEDGNPKEVVQETESSDSITVPFILKED